VGLRGDTPPYTYMYSLRRRRRLDLTFGVALKIPSCAGLSSTLCTTIVCLRESKLTKIVVVDCELFWITGINFRASTQFSCLSPVHTVAEKCDCRRKRRDNGEIRRQSHFSATVWTGF